MRDSIDSRYIIFDLEVCSKKLLFVEKYLITRIGKSVEVDILTQINKVKAEIDELVKRVERQT